MEVGGLAGLKPELAWLGLLVVLARLLGGCRCGGRSLLLVVLALVS